MFMDITLETLKTLLVDLQGMYAKSKTKQVAVEKLRSISNDQLDKLLKTILDDGNLDIEIKALAIEAFYWKDKFEAVQHIASYLNDSDEGLRWHICGVLGDCENEGATLPLVETLSD